MPFTNDILGGNGQLVRKQAQSVNYVPGVSGWIIRQDGTAEFNTGTFRTSVVVGPVPGAHIIMDATTDTILVYNNLNNIIASLSPSNQVISGANVTAGLKTYDQHLSTIFTAIQNAQIQLCDNNVAPLAVPGYIINDNQSAAGQIAQLLFSSGSIGGVPAQEAQIQLISESGNGLFSSWIQLTQQKAGPGAQTSGQAVQTSGTSGSEPFIVHVADVTGTTDAAGKLVVNHGANFTPTAVFVQVHDVGSPGFGMVDVIETSITSTQFQVYCVNFNNTVRASATVKFYYQCWGKA